jgi:hypothetical protein
MSKLYELHIVTFGEREYARKIASFMDKDKKYFHDRILSRNELTNPFSKTDNLRFVFLKQNIVVSKTIFILNRALFPCGDLMVCIIDDRDDVWDYAKNLVCVKPYVFFKNTGDINEPQSKLLVKNKIEQYKEKQNETELKPNEKDEIYNLQTKLIDNKENELINDVKIETNTASTASISENNNNNIENEDDDYLIYLEDILRKVHDEYYRQYEEKMRECEISDDEDDEIDESNLPDMKKVLPQLREQVLNDVVITFSGVVPTDYDLYKQKCYTMAISLGAKVNRDLVFNKNDDDEQQETTHLVAANYGTSKVHEALKLISLNKSVKQLFIVQPEWLIECYQKWVRVDEEPFLLNKDYEYKNCLFHQEYNLYQQRKAQKQQLIAASIKQQQQQVRSVSGSPKRSSSGYYKATKKQRITETSSVKFTIEGEEECKVVEEESSYEFTISNNDLDIMDKEVDELCCDDDSDKNGSEADGDKKSTNSSSSSSSESLSDSSSASGDDDLDDEMVKALERELD